MSVDVTFKAKSRICTYALLGMASIALAGCAGGTEAMNFNLFAATVTAAAYGVFEDPKVNLKEKDYAAADYLISKVSDEVKNTDLITVHPLIESDAEGVTSPLGVHIPEEIGLRLIDLGYTVSLKDVASGQNTKYYTTPKGEERFSLGGHYLRVGNRINISLRMMDVKNNELIGSFDYSMPITYELRKLAETPPQVFKIEKQPAQQQQKQENDMMLDGDKSFQHANSK